MTLVQTATDNNNNKAGQNPILLKHCRLPIWGLCYKAIYGRNELSFDNENMDLSYKTLTMRKLP